MTLCALLISPFVSSITKKFGKKGPGSFHLIGTDLIYVLAYVLRVQNLSQYILQKAPNLSNFSEGSMLIDVYEVESNSIFLKKRLQSDGYAVL